MNCFNNINIEIFGSSHADKIGVKLSGMPLGERVDLDELQRFVDRRKATDNVWSTTRKEPDKIIIEQGITDGVITGDIVASIQNTTIRSKDYDELQYTPRPSHADYPAKLKYGLDYDVKGGGAFSGRMTAPLCISGGIAKQILSKKGISVMAYINKIGGIDATSYDDAVFSKDDILNVQKKDLPVFSNDDKIQELLRDCAKNKDSVGGQIECVVYGVNGGFGGNLFNGIESELSYLLFGIPAVKAVEFGSGVNFGDMYGSIANDGYRYEGGKVSTTSNHNGGILGGISVGNEIMFRVTIKPTPSIAKPQQSVNLLTKQNVDLVIKGRHDVCIVPRAVAVVEAVASLGILDIIGYTK